MLIIALEAGFERNSFLSGEKARAGSHRSHPGLRSIFFGPIGLAWGAPLKQRPMFGLEKLVISTNLPSNTQRETYLGLGRILTLSGTVVALVRQRRLLGGSGAGSHAGA